jgi:glycosyltransferase involved in cell wall biosynthesis
MRVSYISAALDISGYAEAARNHIAALHTAGVNVDVIPISFEGFKSDLGKLGILIHSMVNEKAKNDIQILHLTPPTYRTYISSDKYNIGYAAWETDQLPSSWVGYVNQLDEVWVPCTQNKKVFQNSGVNIPIEVMPHPMNLDYTEKIDIAGSILANKTNDDFMFYSIFQWHERKNPLALLKAYLTEFTSKDKVVLVIKTYLSNPSNHIEIQKIKNLIRDVKARLYLKDYPKILLVTSMLSRGQIQALHDHGNCFVSLHRCEGFGLPIMEAMATGNPVITTGYGGPEDFVPKEVGYPISYTMTPCYGMPWDTYNGHMSWAEPDIIEARNAMRELYTNKEKAESMGSAGKNLVVSDYSWETIGKKMKDRLEIIKEKL